VMRISTEIAQPIKPFFKWTPCLRRLIDDQFEHREIVA